MVGRARPLGRCRMYLLSTFRSRGTAVGGEGAVYVPRKGTGACNCQCSGPAGYNGSSQGPLEHVPPGRHARHASVGFPPSPPSNHWNLCLPSLPKSAVRRASSSLCSLPLLSSSPTSTSTTVSLLAKARQISPRQLLLPFSPLSLPPRFFSSRLCLARLPPRLASPRLPLRPIPVSPTAPNPKRSTLDPAIPLPPNKTAAQRGKNLHHDSTTRHGTTLRVPVSTPSSPYLLTPRVAQVSYHPCPSSPPWLARAGSRLFVQIIQQLRWDKESVSARARTCRAIRPPTYRACVLAAGHDAWQQQRL